LNQELCGHVKRFVDPSQRAQTETGDEQVLSDLQVQAMADPEAAVAEVRAEALVKPTGRIYRQDYVVFLRVRDGRIAFLREYFDPVRAAQAMDAPILDVGG
jgi:ketosteroid isomerase-like protein